MNIKLFPHGNKTKKVKVGVFVQLATWFGDVWAEVSQTFANSPCYKSVCFYHCDGRSDTDISYEYLHGYTRRNNYPRRLESWPKWLLTS